MKKTGIPQKELRADKQCLSKDALKVPAFIPFGNRGIVSKDKDNRHSHADSKEEPVPQGQVEKFSNFFPLQVNKRFCDRVFNLKYEKSHS